MAVPEEGGGARIVTLDEVYAFYREYLGRDPNLAAEALPRVGNSWLGTMAQIRCSQEAANYRANHGAEPDGWCFNKNPVTGAVLPGVQPPTPVVTPVEPPTVDIPIIGGPINEILRRIWEDNQASLRGINIVKDALGDRIGQTFKPILDDIGKAGAKITQSLADNLTMLLPAALELAGEAANRAAEVAESFAAQAASVGDVAGGFIDAIKEQKDGLDEWVGGIGSWIVENGINAALHALEGEGGPTIDLLVNRINEVEGLPDFYKPFLAQAKARSDPFPLIPVLMGLGAGMFGIVGAILIPGTRRATQDANDRDPNEILGAGEFAVAVARELRPYDRMELFAKKQGLNPDQFRLLADLAFQYAPPEQIIAARLRGAIDSDTEDRLLNRHGLDAENRELLRATALQLPGVQDTIRMAVREVFDPKQRGELTLDADYPDALTGFARAIGLSEEWARNLWAGHWELPGVLQVFDMLHRGLMTQEEVRAFLKAADYAPVWRDRLIQLSYDVFTRVDIRRVHDLLDKDHAWLVQQHLRLGYNDADAETLSVFTELLNSDDKKERQKTLTAPLVSRIISATVTGTLSDEQARTFFGSLKYDEEAITTFLTEARLIRNEQRTEKLWNLLGDLYVKNRRTRVEVTEQLRARGATEGEIEERLREWDLERELRAPTEREESERDLTRADIEAGYRARQITRPDAATMLAQLRYDPIEVEFILGMDDYKEAQAIMADLKEVVHKKFVKGTINKVEAAQQLDAAGMRATARDAAIAKWELEQAGKTAELSVGQVGEIYKLEQWDDETTRHYLVRLGYDDMEVSALLRLWGSKIEEAKRRTELAKAKEQEARKREAERIIAAAVRKEKDLAKTDLLAAGAAGTLDWTDVKIALVGIGYSPVEADLLIRTKQAQGVKRNA